MTINTNILLIYSEIQPPHLSNLRPIPNYAKQTQFTAQPPRSHPHYCETKPICHQANSAPGKLCKTNPICPHGHPATPQKIETNPIYRPTTLLSTICYLLFLAKRTQFTARPYPQMSKRSGDPPWRTETNPIPVYQVSRRPLFQRNEPNFGPQPCRPRCRVAGEMAHRISRWP